ncbi:MAG: Asp-tRNA(Asn)/Glu-tRNA(Gln) amidotransferase subunit GatA [Gammaproteobacteria bacterium]
MTELHHRPIAAHAKSLRAGEYSSEELTRHFLARIEAAERLNALITLTPQRALAQAREADRRLREDAASPLAGIPLVHKDLFCTRDVLTSCGSKMLENFISPYDAFVVEKLDACGAVTLAKSNMDEFAMGSSTETSYYGATRNPWDEARVPGGSSGGSACAVAAGLAAAATASDTGGSIRQPAAFCSLTGIKPSYGRVSRYGMVAFASSLDQGGVLARSAEDAALLLREISGFDRRDATSLRDAVPDYPAQLAATGGNALAGKTIGLPKEFFGDGVAPEVADAVEQAVAQLRKLGAKTREVELPNSAAGIPCYYVLAPAEASSNLARFDGIRYGHRAAEYADLTDFYERTRAEGFGEEVKRRLLIGAFVLAAGYYDAYYIKAQQLRRLIAGDFARAFEKCDLLAGPTTPQTAFALGEKIGDPVAMYLNDIFTNAVNLAGLPGISIPAGFDRAGLPVGLQLIGRYLDEETLLCAAHQYQLETDWHLRAPQGHS